MRRSGGLWAGFLAATVVAGVLPASASAVESYCVKVPSCPAGHIKLNDVKSALAAADSDADLDTIQIGPGTFNETGLSNSEPVTIFGAGQGTTVLRSSDPVVLDLEDSTSEVRDLTIRMTEDDQNGLRLDLSSARRVRVITAPGVLPFHGVRMDGASFRDGFVSTPAAETSGRGAIEALNGSSVASSTLIGDTALRMDGADGTGRRLRLVGAIAFITASGTQRLSQILALPHPDQSPDDPFNAIRATGSTGADARIEITHLTAVGQGAGVAGFDGGFIAQGSASAAGQIVARNAVLRGMDLNVNRSSSGADADVTASYSSFDPGKRSPDTVPGQLTTGPGNLDSDEPARFVDPAAGDFRLRHDSPLLDRGDPAAPSFAETLIGDLDGKNRFRDSDGDGTARRDIGAHEYQRLPPTATFTTNSPVLFNSPMLFNAAGSFDPDGDPLSFGWTFEPNRTGTGRQTKHTYGTPGKRSVALAVTDPTGLAGTATREVRVKLRPGRCANVRSGGPGNDTIIGFAAGDRLRGRAGADRLEGRKGRDCLHGDRGKDTLLGGNGNDELRGGRGTNVLEGGRGADVIRARNDRRDTIDCGAGTNDRAVVDPSDDVEGCETVNRG